MSPQNRTTIAIDADTNTAIRDLSKRTGLTKVFILHQAITFYIHEKRAIIEQFIKDMEVNTK